MTDGDIRRAIINGQKLNQPIKKIYNRKPNFLIKGNYSLNTAKNLLTIKNHILIPVVNNKNIIVDYLNWEKYLEKKKRKKVYQKFL